MSDTPEDTGSLAGDAVPAIPGYRIVRELGRGGMATVYLAVQESLGRDVALKLLNRRLADDPTASARFVREARTAARLVHRHIVGIHEVGAHAGQPYLAMEYLPAGTLSGNALAPARALEAAREIALALDHAHAQGVIHRDIKPENILRRADGSCALADFGIARTAEDGGGMTQDGVTLGTPHYMSPEQLQGAELDGRSDLYSLGVVLFQLLTGHVPYAGTDGWAVGMQHISAPLPQLPEPLARYQPLIDALMAKDPARRPPTGADAARLIELATGTTHSAPTRAMTLPSRAPTRRAWVGIGAAIALLLLAGWLGWSRWGDAPPATAVPPPLAAAPQAERSIAVLPFVNLSGDPANEYFSDGVAETTLDMLAQLKDLKVIARTSSFAFKGKPADMREIGKALGAAHLLEGSVQQAGDTVRITVQLIRVADGSHLWSKKFDRKLVDVFKIQDEIASAVVDALQLALPAPEQARLLSKRTDNVAAYREYLKGAALLPKRRVPDLRAAAAHFERAVALDPGFARAHVGIADAYRLLGQYARVTPEQQAASRRHLEIALELAPQLGEAHVSRGAMLESAGDYAGSEREYRLGISLAPGYATGHQWLGELLGMGYGQFDEAVLHTDRARQLDPLSVVVRDVHIFMLGQAGRLDEAMAQSNALIAEHPDIARNYSTRATLHFHRQDLVSALRDLRRHRELDPESVGFQAQGCMGLIDMNALAEARACADALADPEHDSMMVLAAQARVAAWQGRWEEARLLLLRASPQLDNHLGRVELAQGRPEAALAIFARIVPQLLETPPVVTSGQAADAIWAGRALLDTGKQEQGRRLLERAIAVAESRPYSVAFGGRGWLDVIAAVQLGRIDDAFARLQAGVANGYFQQLGLLDIEPTLAAFRADPRYARILAPARARSAAELDRARAAGLLRP